MKSKLIKIFTLAISAILLIGCFIGFTASAEDTVEPNVEILFNNLEYGDNISILYATRVNGVEPDAMKMNFYAKNEEGKYVLVNSTEEYYVDNVTVNGNTNTYNVFKSPGIAPKFMPEIIYAQLVISADGVEYASNMSRFSIVEYCYKRLYKDVNITADQKDLYNHVIGYGTAAQKVLGHKIDDTPAHYFYVNAADAVVDYVEIDGNTYSYSAGIFKAGESVALTYTKALGIAEFAEWGVSYKDAAGVTTETLDNKTVVTVADKHIIAVPSVKLISEDFDNGTSGVITNVTTNESLISFSVVDSPDAAYEGDKALKVGKAASKTSSVATTTIPLMNSDEGNCYIFSYDFRYDRPPHTGGFATIITKSSSVEIFKTSNSYMSNANSSYGFYTMYSNGNGNAGYRYLYSGNYNAMDKWVNVRYEYYRSASGVWTARFYLDDVFISENIVSNSSTALSEISIIHNDLGGALYYDNMTFVRCDKAFTDTPETAAPSFAGTKGEGKYYNSAIAGDYVVDFDIDYSNGSGNGRPIQQADTGPCVTTGNDVLSAYNANGYAYAYRTKESSEHSTIQYTTVKNTNSYDTTIVEFDMAISKPTNTWPVVISIGNGVFKGDVYIGYNATTGKLYARDTKVDIETDVWNNYKLVIDNTSFDSTKKTASAELFVNDASVGKVVLYDSYTNSNAMFSVWLRGGNEGLVVCYDNIFVGYRNSSEE